MASDSDRVVLTTGHYGWLLKIRLLRREVSIGPGVNREYGRRRYLEVNDV